MSAALRKSKVPDTKTLARRLGLTLVTPEALTIQRVTEKNADKGWIFLNRHGRKITNPRNIARFMSLAVPPAYIDVYYASDPRAHLQAVGRDSAGRTQYRYHPDWEKIREIRKAQHLRDLAAQLPAIRRAIATNLEEEAGSKNFAAAAVVALIDASGIRAGSEEYAKANRTRGAATLLKSNVKLENGTIRLCFRGKGGKQHDKEFENEPLHKVLTSLKTLPGKRLFQHRVEDKIQPVTAREVNLFLKEIAGCAISLKDFRTLCGTAEVLCRLSQLTPAENLRHRKIQITDAIKSAAEALGNTPAICRRSYVHPSILTAFEEGMLAELPAKFRLRSSRAATRTVLGLVTNHAAAE